MIIELVKIEVVVFFAHIFSMSFWVIRQRHFSKNKGKINFVS